MPGNTHSTLIHHSSQNLSQEGETPHAVLSSLLAVLLGMGVLSLMVAWLEQRRSRKRLVVVARVWSERQKSYQDDQENGMEGWRLATVAEVEERGADILEDVAKKTVNVYRISKCQVILVLTSDD